MKSSQNTERSIALVHEYIGFEQIRWTGHDEGHVEAANQLELSQLRYIGHTSDGFLL